MRIAIIGNGPAAVAVTRGIYQSRSADSEHVDLVIYGSPEKYDSTGLAFSNDTDTYLINVPNIGVFVDDTCREGYYHWLKDQNINVKYKGAYSHSPRKMFGRYLKQLFSAIRNDYNSLNWRIDTISKEITAIDLLRSKVGTPIYQIDGKAYDAVVLCIGAGEYKDPYSISSIQNYICGPYPSTNLNVIGSDDSVGVIGTSLTACDAALYLLKNRKCNDITMFSRKGILPSIRHDPRQLQLRYLTSENIDRIYAERHELSLHVLREVLEQELSAFGAVPKESISTLFDSEASTVSFRNSLSGQDQPIIQAIVQSTEVRTLEKIFSYIDMTDRNVIFSGLNAGLRALQCPIPAESARVLDSAMSNDKLHIMSGVRSINWIEEHNHFEVQFRSHGPVSCKYVVDGTRSIAGTGESTVGSELVTCMIDAGMIIRNDYFGIAVDPKTNRAVNSFGDLSNIYAIGELTRGNLFYSSSLPEVARGARRAATSIMSTHSCE